MKIAIDRNQTGLFQKDTNTSSRWRVPLMCGTSWACPPRRPPSPRTRSSTRTRRKRRRRKSQGCFKDQRECIGEVLFTLQQQPKHAPPLTYFYRELYNLLYSENKELPCPLIQVLKEFFFLPLVFQWKY